MGRGPSIEGRKNAEDAKRAKVFTKLIREITVAARGGADPAANPRLRAAVDKALSANMSKDTVERAVRRGSVADGADDLQEIRYEGYAPGGIAILVDCMTDNAQRAVADVRHALSKHGGSLGTPGSVAFQFARTGEVVVATPDAAAESRAFEAALEAGADDVQAESGLTNVLCAGDQVAAVKAALEKAGFAPERAGVVMRAANRVAIEGEAAETLESLLEWLDELDDVQDVWHNAALPGA